METHYTFSEAEFSAQAQQQVTIALNQLYTYHNDTASHSVISLLLPCVSGARRIGLFACIGLVVHFVENCLSVNSLVVLMLSAPTAFSIFSLYTCKTVIELPGLRPDGFDKYFNVRYGLLPVTSVAIAIAVLVYLLSARQLVPNRHENWSTVLYRQMTCSGAIAVRVLAIVQNVYMANLPCCDTMIL